MMNNPYAVLATYRMEYLALQEYLNEKHCEGWDVVSVSGTASEGFLIVLRRRENE